MSTRSLDDLFLDDLGDKLRPTFDELAASRPTDRVVLTEATKVALVAAGRASRWALLAKLGLVAGGGVVAAALVFGGGSPADDLDKRPASAVTQAVAAAEPDVTAPEVPEPPEPDAAALPELEVERVAEGEAEPVIEASAPALSKPAQPRLSAVEMLERAKASRRAGNYQQAVSRYRALERSYPQSREAGSARIARGRLLLGPLADPRQALRAFERYLSTTPKGSLAPEAAAGIARAHRALGDDAAERLAWRDLIERFPNSVYVSEARARLGVQP